MQCSSFMLPTVIDIHLILDLCYELTDFYFNPLKNKKKLLIPLHYKLQQNFFHSSLKLIECLASVVSVVSPNSSVRPLPKTEIFFFLLSTCIEELLSTPNIVTFLRNPLPSDNKNVHCVSNPVPYPENYQGKQF